MKSILKKSKTSDKILEDFIVSYAEGHADHVCSMIKQKKQNVERFCEYFIRRCMEELGEDKVKNILNGGNKNEK